MSFPTTGGLVHEQISENRLKIIDRGREPRYEDIISIENLLLAWREFKSGKQKKLDVQEFSLHLMDNILALHEELKHQIYKHGGYYHFKINDPKPRDIHKASVRDRLVHHALYRILYPFFDRTFITDSFSCRVGKGTHKALNRFRTFSYHFQKSKRNIRTCWVLKCDIRKFFANINHEILLDILRSRIIDDRIFYLLRNIIASFSTSTGSPHACMTCHTCVGLPLGNLTSQLLVNVYMNEFDQFVKHELKAKHYIRYADDFVFLADDRNSLKALIPRIREFLKNRLRLELHPEKLFLKTLASGVDFLGWVHFPDHRVLRTAAKKRMMRNLGRGVSDAKVASYRGMLSHGNAEKLLSAIDLLSSYDIIV